jgi:hypothetical protein
VLVLLLLSIVPRDSVYRESVDLVEVNHFYDDKGRLVFDQTIFYDWSNQHDREADCRYNIRAWRLIKTSSQIPLMDWRTGYFRAMWWDGEQLREVFSRSERETWFQHDVELVERDLFLPKERRRELKHIHVDRPSGAIRPKSPLPVFQDVEKFLKFLQ